MAFNFSPFPSPVSALKICFLRSKFPNNGKSEQVRRSGIVTINGKEIFAEPEIPLSVKSVPMERSD
jgi:hypothetical protein